MYELISGNVKQAASIFADGLQRTPYFRMRDSFRTALALAEIKSQHFTEATHLLNGAQDPLQSVILSICYVLGGDRSGARKAIAPVNDNVAPKLLTLKAAILARVDHDDQSSSDQWFVKASEEAVLQLAA